MIRKIKTYSGTRSQQVSEREVRNRVIARKAAAESIVLLQNDGILPLQEGTRVALFGSGATQTIKGGTGSGDVNEREVTDIYTGMKNAGFSIANEAWLLEYRQEYQRAKEIWRDRILAAAGNNKKDPHVLIHAYVNTKFETPIGRKLTQQEIKDAQTDIAIYVLSRNAGEAADRWADKGDYYLTDEEKEWLSEINRSFPRVILVLNCGGPIDLSFADELRISALIQLSQPGMEGGNAFADVVKGAVNPSGKMSDTWAIHYEDYPNSATFSHNNGNVEQELYEEGIYVGYRYFDTFNIKQRIPFGFGLSYTDFSIHTKQTFLIHDQKDEIKVAVQVEVENTGKAYAGKEVVQVYASCPQGELKKEYQRLCAFGKTPLLQPGEKCTMQLTFPISQLASFSQKEGAYILEKGDYLIAVGNSSISNIVTAKVFLDKTVRLLIVDRICPLRQPLKEIEPDCVPQRAFGEITELRLSSKDIIGQIIRYSGPTPEKMEGLAGELVETLGVEQLLSLTSGDPGKGQDTSGETFGSSGLTVPGAAGETHNCASGEPWNIASIVLADGPAGLRLAQRYTVKPDGSIIKPNFADSIEHGIFADNMEIPDATYYYQYCTAIPVGTMLAQSWDTELVREVGAAVAEEMEEFGITLWLAPGMNIHRNPLCGRNFEYYSEDPLLSGVIAAAITQGVQGRKGTGTTIKHFACNNQEDNRKHSSSVVSERALREIYLHGFEIAVKHSQPMAIMTSYNLLNGVHTANSYDLITKVARDEWGFKGMVMSDWTTTGEGGSSPVKCMRAGNDLIMPGDYEDIELIRKALDGTGEDKLELKELKKCAAHIVNIVLQSNEYLDCKSYSEQFEDLQPYVESRIL
jgi:beta-glucosidase